MLFLLFVFISNGEQGRWAAPPYGGQYYVFMGTEEKPQINVQIWDNIVKPGLYSVPKATDIITLISLAGGPKDGADLSKVKIIRHNPQYEVIIVNLNNYINGKEKFVYILQPEDIVIIPECKIRSIIRVFSSLPWAQVSQALMVYLLIRDILTR